MSNTGSAFTGMFAGLVAAVAFVAFSTGLARADGPSELTRKLGYELLRIKMIEHKAEQLRLINLQAPGYWQIGYEVRIG